jgi:threonine aldolase
MLVRIVGAALLGRDSRLSLRHEGDGITQSRVLIAAAIAGLQHRVLGMRTKVRRIGAALP